MSDLDAFMAPFVLVMVPLGFFGVISLLWFYFKINRTLFLEYHELWERLGCPGAGMWMGNWSIPGRKGIWADNRSTNRFWRDKWFRLKETDRASFPEDILNLFCRFHRVSRVLAVFTVVTWLVFMAAALSGLS